MKKQISFVSIGLMIVTGLVLALPFSRLRKSMQILDSTNQTFAIVNPVIKNSTNLTIAQVVADGLQVNSYSEMGVNNSANNKDQLTMNTSSNTVNSIHESANSRQTQQAIDGSNIAVGTPLPVDRSLAKEANGTDINRTSYKTNMTARTSVNNSNSRLMVMSGSFNSATATAQGSVRQMAGGAPPPSEDEIVPPIGTLPVGDGFSFMILLVTLFGVFKARKLIKV